MGSDIYLVIFSVVYTLDFLLAAILIGMFILINGQAKANVHCVFA